jgi:DtxR family transcriptional regulator, Mn-dependent transcriptional regulator
MISLAEENYLKTIFHLARKSSPVSTNDIADTLKTSAASVTEMIKRLASKALITYEKYHGVAMTKTGQTQALMVVRKHRLWETFLVQKLGLSWDQVHEIAEQLEHIQSPLLVEKLDSFLGHPTVDPHGHPIPDKNGRVKEARELPLASAEKTSTVSVTSVRDSSPAFLQYLDKVGIGIGISLVVEEKTPFDGSVTVVSGGKKRVTLSKEVSNNILVNSK